MLWKSSIEWVELPLIMAIKKLSISVRKGLAIKKLSISVRKGVALYYA
jgi:hypothetical protein